MASVTFRHITKIFGRDVKAVDDLNLDIKDGEFMVLVGPSGCGKTTALRMVAGLEETSSGQILIDDGVVNDLPSKDRDIAMVFQNYALYPHMNVYDNIAFGLRLREMSGFFWQLAHLKQAREVRLSIDQRVKEVSEMLGIKQLLDRKPKELSGGQRQRVALARAIVRKPKVFLMDEPLSNLDAKLRLHTRAELIKLHRALGVTTIYVTHDQVEAMTMGQRVAVMKDGVLQQCASPQIVYSRPANQFVAGFIGSPPMNFAKAEIDREGTKLFATSGPLKIPVDADEFLIKEGQSVVLGVRPEAILDPALSADFKSATRFKAKVDVAEPLGHAYVLYLAIGDINFLACVDSGTKIREGETAEFAVRSGDLHLFDALTGEALRYTPIPAEREDFGGFEAKGDIASNAR